MDSSKSSPRKNFRCVFNHYVTKENQDAVIRSVISQFEGYFADPEVTTTEDGFIITLSLGENLNPTSVRDKILWNQFIDRVTAQDSIRKIQIIRLPKAGVMDFGERADGVGSVGGFGPVADPFTGDTRVDEKLNIPLTEKPRKYQIDGVSDDSLGNRASRTFNSSLHYADPTDLISEDQSFDKGLTPADLHSDSTSVEEDPHSDLDSGKREIARVFNAFKIISFESDLGDSFTLNKPNGFQDVDEPPDQGPLHQRAVPGTGIGGGAPISGASWYVTQPGNEQGTEMGTERNNDNASAAPLSGISAFGGKIVDEPEAEDVKSALDLPQSRGGSQSVPDGGQVEGWFASAGFGINETYDYEGDVDFDGF